MPRLRLTDRGIRSLRTDRAQVDFFDAGFPSFMLRVSRTGVRVFYFRYRRDGRYRRIRIGPYPAVSLGEARARARDLESAVRRGEDPAHRRDESRSVPTVRELAEDFIERYARPRKRSWRGDERLLESNVLPYVGHLKAKEVRRRDILKMLDRIVDRGAPVVANRTLAVVRKLYNWAIERDLVTTSPCLGVKPPAPERPVDRVLSETEIRELWVKLGEVEPTVAADSRLLLLTAQRRGEVVEMRWEQFDKGLWTIPAETAKNGIAHSVPVVGLAAEIVEAQRGLDASWVLPSPRKAGARLRPDSLTRVATRIRRDLGYHWTPHDLRRSAASHMAAMGVPRLVISKILNHSDSSVTSIYDRHSYLPEMRRALERWGERVEELAATPVGS